MWCQHPFVIYGGRDQPNKRRYISTLKVLNLFTEWILNTHSGSSSGGNREEQTTKQKNRQMPKRNRNLPGSMTDTDGFYEILLDMNVFECLSAACRLVSVDVHLENMVFKYKYLAINIWRFSSFITTIFVWDSQQTLGFWSMLGGGIGQASRVRISQRYGPFVWEKKKSDQRLEWFHFIEYNWSFLYAVRYVWFSL